MTRVTMQKALEFEVANLEKILAERDAQIEELKNELVQTGLEAQKWERAWRTLSQEVAHAQQEIRELRAR